MVQENTGYDVAQNPSLSQKIKHPFFSAQKEEDAYEVTVSLTDELTYEFVQFNIHYNTAETKTIYKGTELRPHTYHFRLPLEDLFNENADVVAKETFSIYFTLRVKENDDWIEQDYPLSLALFDQFDAFGLSQTIYQKQIVIPYFTEKEEIFSLALNVPVPNSQYFSEHTLNVFKLSNSEFSLKGKLSLKAFTLNQIGITLVANRSGKEYFFSTNHTLNEQETETHLNHYDYNFTLDVQRFARNMLIDNIADEDYDVYFELYLNGLYNPISVPVTTNGLSLPRNCFKDVVLSYGKSSFVLGLNLKGSQQAISFAFTKYQKEIYAYYKEAAPLSILRSPLNQRKNIWVIGENPMEANNNGWAFFCYLREQHPEQLVYYVLDTHSPDYAKAYAYDSEHLLEFKSKRYIDTLLAAKVLFFTETPYELYPSRSPMQIDLIRAKKIFLQNNVLGLENVSDTLGYTAKNFQTDLVLASSKTEERYLQQTLGYPEKMIRLTGLPRFDELLKEPDSLEVASNLVIYPHDSSNSLYYQKDAVHELAEAFLSLVKQPEFTALVTEHYLTTIVALPRSMQDYAEKFEELGCTVVAQKQIDPLPLLRTCKMFITDHNPLAFDASFLQVPVLFYQPDLRFQRNSTAVSLRNTYLNELPGEIATSQNSLLYLMHQVAAQQFKQSRKNRQKADALMHYPDTKSCDRVFKAVTEYLQ